MSASPSFEEEYFRSNYPDYARQNPPKKLRFYRELAERACRGIERPRVLELGCGFGLFLEALGPRWERFGTDLSAYALEHAQRAVPAASLKREGATERSFEGTFDLVAAFDVLEHVPDLERTGAMVGDALEPGGHLVFVVPVYDGPTGPAVHLLDRDPTHVHKKGRGFWLDWASARFRIVAWCGIYRLLLPGGFYVHRTTHLLRRMTPAIAVVARKA